MLKKEYQFVLNGEYTSPETIALAESLASQGKYNEAEQVINEYEGNVSKYPNSEWSLSELRAAIYNGLNNYLRAKEILVNNNESNSLNKLRELCKAEIGLNNFESAREYAIEAINLKEKRYRDIIFASKS